jgi:hypothetical protein
MLRNVMTLLRIKYRLQKKKKIAQEKFDNHGVAFGKVITIYFQTQKYRQI